MATNETLGLTRALASGLTHHREYVPVYRLRPPSVPALIERARVLGGRFVSGRTDTDPPRIDLRQGKDRTLVRLPDGGYVNVYHASGAIAMGRRLDPFSYLIGREVDQDRLVGRATAMINRLEALWFRTGNERVVFERLWQIKAQGMARNGEIGQQVVCRVVAAFRRYVGDLPVWGRASIMVKLAGNELVEAAGIDWRDRVEEPVDQAKLIDPEEAITRVMAELAAATPGRQPRSSDYEAVLFSVGYFSLPKRRTQGYLQPVYVAALRARGDMTLSRLVVIPAAATPYEPIARLASAPQITVARRAAGAPQ
jgi:hypothetical protein